MSRPKKIHVCFVINYQHHKWQNENSSHQLEINHPHTRCISPYLTHSQFGDPWLPTSIPLLVPSNEDSILRSRNENVICKTKITEKIYLICTRRLYTQSWTICHPSVIVVVVFFIPFHLHAYAYICIHKTYLNSAFVLWNAKRANKQTFQRLAGKEADSFALSLHPFNLIHSFSFCFSLANYQQALHPYPHSLSLSFYSRVHTMRRYAWLWHASL